MISKILWLLETAMNYLYNKYNIFSPALKNPRCTTVWNIKVFLKLHLVNFWWQSCAKLLWKFFNCLLIGKHILRIWNIASMLQWPLTRLPYYQSSKCPPLVRTQAQRLTVHQLRYQLHSVEGRAKCPTVQLRELVISILAAGQGSK